MLWVTGASAERSVVTTASSIAFSNDRAVIPSIVATLMADIDDLVVLIGADLRPKWSSRPFSDLDRRSLDSFRPGSLAELIHPDDQERLRELRSELLATPGGSVECQVRLATSTGVFAPVRLRGTNHFHDPAIDGLVVTIRWLDSATKASARAVQRAVPTPTAAPESVFPLAGLIDDVTTAFTPIAERRATRIDVRLDPDVPTDVRAPRLHLHTMLTHLTAAALPVAGDSESEGMSLTIEITLATRPAPRSRLRFSIRSTKSDADDTRWSNLEPPELLTAKALAEDLRSAIEVTNDDSGTEMSFEIDVTPARRITDRVDRDSAIRASTPSREPEPTAPEPTAPEPTAPEPTASTTPRPRAGRILVVDDSDVNRLLATAQLDRLGYEHLDVSSGEEALRIMRSGTVAAVLMDWHMPGLDGLATTRRWRAIEGDSARLPIISMTASAMNGDRERCLDAGASDYLPKPVSIDDLATMLDRWLPESGIELVRETGPAPAPKGAIDELITDLGDVAVVRSIVDTYEAMIPGMLAEAQAGMAERDHAVVRRSAHTLKSTATMLGLHDFAATCFDLEQRAERGDDLERSLEQYARSCDAALQTLSELSATLLVRATT